MRVTGITKEQLVSAARIADVLVDVHHSAKNGTSHAVKVNPLRPNRWQRINASSGRKVNAVCWHGFRDFFRAAFTMAPNAIFHTTLDTWKGAEDFETRYRESGYRNSGAAYPRRFDFNACQSCECPESGLAR